jgi:hypothetical protein
MNKRLAPPQIIKRVSAEHGPHACLGYSSQLMAFVFSSGDVCTDGMQVFTCPKLNSTASGTSSGSWK